MRGTVVATRFARSFHYKDFRFLWCSDAFIGLGEQMELVLIGWFVLEKTESALLVTTYGALRFTGTLFAPIFGVIADRYDRKTLLVLVRVIFLGVAATILALSAVGSLSVWAVLLLAGTTGMGRGFDNVIRQAVLADIVPRPLLMNAVAVTRTARDATQMVAPLIAGFMLAKLGMSPPYSVVVGFYVAAILAALALTISSSTAMSRSRSVWRDSLLALAYVRRHEMVLGLLLLAFLVNLTAFPLNNGLMPLFAKNVLELGPAGLGGLLSAYSAGALLGSVVVAVIPTVKRPGRLIVCASLVWHVCLLLFSFSVWVVPSVTVLVFTGIAQSFTMVLMGMLLLQVTGRKLLGRVMGLRSLAIYGLPVGLLATGAIADTLGAPATLAVTAALGIFLSILLPAWLTGMWRFPNEDTNRE